MYVSVLPTVQARFRSSKLINILSLSRDDWLLISIDLHYTKKKSVIICHKY